MDPVIVPLVALEIVRSPIAGPLTPAAAALCRLAVVAADNNPSKEPVIATFVPVSTAEAEPEPARLARVLASAGSADKRVLKASPLCAASESASPPNPIPITAIATRRLKAISGLPFYIEVLDEWLLRERPRRRQRRFIVRMIGHFLHVLYVLEGVIFIQNENRAALNPHVFDQRSIVLAERS
jgi:hypothetical protein